MHSVKTNQACPRGRSFLLIQLRQIGDVVLTTPLARILKEAEPDCHVTFLTEAPSDQYLRGNPYIDRICLNRRSGTLWETLQLGRGLRSSRFDVVMDFMGNPRSALLSFASGAPLRISYKARGRGFYYTHRIVADAPYAVEVKKRLLAPLGIQGTVNRPEIFLSGEEQSWAEDLRQKLLQGGRRHLVTVDPSHRRETRRWPAEHYGRLCALFAADLDARPVVLWGPGEEELAERVVSTSDGFALKAPPTGLREMAALIAAADLHLGNCSAPRHVAVAVGTPTFTVLGSTSVGWTHPAPEHNQIALDLECQPCDSNTCSREMACLVGLSPEQVCQEMAQWTRNCLNWSDGEGGDDL